MPFSSLGRHIYGRKSVSFFFGVLTNQTAASTDVAGFACPVTGSLKNIKVSTLDSATGTTPTLSAQVKRGSTILGTAAGTNTTSGVVADSGNLTVAVSQNEELIIAFTTANNDNDFVGVTVQVEFEHDLGDDGNLGSS